MIGVVDEIEALFARSFKKFYKAFNLLFSLRIWYIQKYDFPQFSEFTSTQRLTAGIWMKRRYSKDLIGRWFWTVIEND